MTVYLLDTNTISELMRDPLGRVGEEYRRLSRRGTVRVVTSVVVACEMRYGVAKKGSAKLAVRVEEMLGTIEVLPLPAEADVHYGRLRAELESRGEPIGANDMLLAAHAQALKAVLVTDNVREFKRVKGLRVENWTRP
jgi:tRNA(fMet)-specific endonuclease VapC